MASSAKMCLPYPSTAACVLALLSLLATATASEPSPHICLIGGGIASASAAHFLTEPSLSPHPRLTLFEKTSTLGGRIATLEVTTASDKLTLEAGASIIAGENRLMSSFVSLLNLTRREPTGGTLGLWTGSAFAIRTHRGAAMRARAAFLLRYGWSLLRQRAFVRRLLDAYARLYPAGGASWPPCGTVAELFERCGSLYNLTQHGFAGVAASEFNERFRKEMVSAITRVNYGQDVEQMNALAGAVALAGSGSDLWAVAGGNKQVVEGLVKRAGVEVLLETPVQRISVSGDGSERVYIVHAETSQWECNAVVLGAPYELANIELPDEMAVALNVGRTFHSTHATFLRGFLNVATFGSNPPDAVLTVEGADEPFMSVGLQWRSNGSATPPIFKVFSRERLDEVAKARIFEKGAELIAEFPWLAYPDFAPPEKFATLDVDGPKGTFIYTSPIESAGSAMEMSAVSGANAAALIRKKLGMKYKQQQDNQKKDEL